MEIRRKAIAGVAMSLGLPGLALAQDGESSGFSTETIMETLSEQVAPWGAKIVGALVALFIAWIVAGAVGRTVRKGGEKRKLDVTLTRFFAGMARNLVLIAAVVAILGVFGIETSSFAAIIGAAGLAVGLAFQGTLGSFASGVLLLVFRPFKVGDVVEAGGVVGVVEEIELFTTVIKTLDNQKLIVPNSKVAGDTIRNAVAYDTRRVDIDVGCDYNASIDDCRAALEESIQLVDKALKDPEPQVFLAALGGSSVDWQVRIWCKTEDYWDVHQATVRAIHVKLAEKGIGIPYPTMDVNFNEDILKALGKS
ncbi:MAG: mechanosensitive ion channel domain-containing protein [Myxococcota bacterium]